VTIARPYPAMKATVNAGWLGGTATTIMLAIALTLHAQGAAEESKCLADNLKKKILTERKVPDVRGCEYQQLAAALRFAHQTPAIQFGPSTMPAGRIFEQTPDADSAWVPSTRIGLSVSDGTAPDRTGNSSQENATITAPDSQKTAWWLWIVAAGALLAAAITMARAIRKWRWRRLLRITPSVELTGKSSAMPIAMAAPPLGLDAQLEIGEAAPIGPIPVSKLEKSDDN